MRVSYFNNGSGAEVLEENNYYPFGLKHEGYNALAGNPAYQYKYNEKELQQETGWSDYGWRQYMPEIGKWNGMDQLSEKYYSISPFAYVANNPISSFDVDGRLLAQNLINQINGASSGTVFTNNGSGFDDNWGGSMDYFGNSVIHNFHFSTSLGQRPGEGGGGGQNSPLELIISGLLAQQAFDLLQASVSDMLDLTFHKKTGNVTGTAKKGVVLTDAAKRLLELLDPTNKVTVMLDTKKGFFFYDANLKRDVYFEADAFRGNFRRDDGGITATNYVSPDAVKGFDFASESPLGTGVLHAALEAYAGAIYFPGNNGAATAGQENLAYDISHDWAACWDRPNYKNTPSNYRVKLNGVGSNGKVKTISPYLYDINTGKIIYNFGTFNY